MKYSTLLALANAIKINDETCSSTPQAYLAQNGLEVEALAQVDSEFIIDQSTSVPSGADKLSLDMMDLGLAIGVSSPGHNYGSEPGTIPVGGDANIYAFLHTLYLKSENIEALLATQAAAESALKQQIIDANAALERRIFDAENLVIRSITGIGQAWTPQEYYDLTEDLTRTAELGLYKSALAVNSLNYVLYDGDIITDGIDTILLNIKYFEEGVNYSTYVPSTAVQTLVTYPVVVPV